MNTGQVRMLGFACLIVCLVCLFIGAERYYANANNVKAMNEFGRAMGAIPGEMRLTPGVPTATVYAGFFALLSGVGGTILLIKSKTKS